MDQFAQYWEIRNNREAWRRAGGCECCSSVVGRTPAPRAYWWTGPNGNVEGLCEQCCNVWRQSAEEDPSLTPRSVVPCS